MVNEARHLGRLKEIVLSQTARPRIWVIGDGGSTDKSYSIAKELFRGHDWIYVIRQKNYSGEGYSHENFSNNVNDCLRYARALCANNNILYDFVGKTDATPALDPDYFEVLQREMENNPKLAFTCGAQYILQPDGRTYEHIKGFNDIRLYRREFLEEMGGYPVAFSPDTILMIKALNRHWEVKKVPATSFKKSRIRGSKIGFWGGYRLIGKGMYRIGYNPILLLMNAIFYTRTPPHYLGLAVVSGYMADLIRREEKIKDPEVLKYFWHDRLVQITKGMITEGNV